jgi:lipopolysaccharide export LptBFGC system permease protein LptF
MTRRYNHRRRSGDGFIAVIAGLIMGFFFLVLTLLSVLLTAGFWALVIWLVLWILEAFFGIELLSTIKETLA